MALTMSVSRIRTPAKFVIFNKTRYVLLAALPAAARYRADKIISPPSAFAGQVPTTSRSLDLYFPKE